MTIVLIIASMVFQACGLLRVHSYLIPAKMEPGWITIEHKNPKCQPLKESLTGQEFVIPDSGFLCTSSPMYMGWHREKYYLVDENGGRTPIEIDERIFRRESSIVNQPSLDAGMPACKVTTQEFFYGPKEKLTYENPIMEDEKFLAFHPECRHRGITTKVVP